MDLLQVYMLCCWHIVSPTHTWYEHSLHATSSAWALSPSHPRAIRGLLLTCSQPQLAKLQFQHPYPLSALYPAYPLGHQVGDHHRYASKFCKLGPLYAPLPLLMPIVLASNPWNAALHGAAFDRDFPYCQSPLLVSSRSLLILSSDADSTSSSTSCPQRMPYPTSLNQQQQLSLFTSVWVSFCFRSALPFTANSCYTPRRVFLATARE